MTPARKDTLPPWLAPLSISLLLATTACKRQHFSVESAPELPYPTCEGPAQAPKILAQGTLRSGPIDTRMPIVETWRLEQRGCLFAAVTRQEWPMQIADVEALYDSSWKPLRVWRRHTVPGSKRQDGAPDFKLYELRTPDAVIKHKDDTGKVDLELLKGKGQPQVFIGPGRGALTAWLWQAKLAVGQKTHSITLDFRGIEKIERGLLERFPDKDVPELGGKVRVYTFFGKETIFADENDVVIGDLAGLVPDERAKGPKPPPMSKFEAIDPVHTP